MLQREAGQRPAPRGCESAPLYTNPVTLSGTPRRESVLLSRWYVGAAILSPSPPRSRCLTLPSATRPAGERGRGEGAGSSWRCPPPHLPPPPPLAPSGVQACRSASAGERGRGVAASS